MHAEDLEHCLNRYPSLGSVPPSAQAGAPFDVPTFGCALDASLVHLRIRLAAVYAGNPSKDLERHYNSYYVETRSLLTDRYGATAPCTLKVERCHARNRYKLHRMREALIVCLAAIEKLQPITLIAMKFSTCSRS